MTRPRSTRFSVLAAALLCGCAAPPPVAPPAPQAPPAPPRDEATAAAIGQALAGDHRAAENRARDAARHPVETLLFFGIKPEMTVVEAWPRAGEWYTEILAPLLSANGRLLVATRPPSPGNAFVTSRLKAVSDKLASRPEVYSRVQLTLLGPGDIENVAADSADLVLTFDSLHAWMNLGFAPEILAAIHRVLKPGGILGVVSPRADPAAPQDPRAPTGYVSEEYAIRLIEAAGFELLEKSEVNANPLDTRDHEQGVWALAPDFRAGNRDRAKYEAIGEPDRFTLKFRKRAATSGSLPN